MMYGVWLFLACSALTSSECSSARDAEQIARTQAAELAGAEAERTLAEARMRHADGAKAADAEAQVPDPPVFEINQIQVSQQGYTRARVGGASLEEASTAAQNAELALRTRKVLVSVEAETRRLDALTARIDAWRTAEATWRAAGGLDLLTQALRRSTGGAAPALAPVQDQATLVEPEGAASVGEQLQGAQKAHEARVAAEGDVPRRRDKLDRVRQHALTLEVQVGLGAATDPELQSTANEARLVLGRARASLERLDAALAAGTTLDAATTLPLAPMLASSIESAQAAQALMEQLCR